METITSANSSKLDLLPAEVLGHVTSFLPCSSILALCFSNRRLYAACYVRIVFKRNAINAIHEERYTYLEEVGKSYWDFDEASLSSQATTEVDSEDEWCSESDSEEDLGPESEWDFDDWGPDRMPYQEWLLSWPCSSVFDNLSASDSARIAYAVEKAQKYFNVSLPHQSRDLSQAWKKGRWNEWLPQLIALGHISSLELKPWTLQCLLFEPGVMWDDGPSAKRNPSSSEYLTAGFCMLTLMLAWMETKRSTLVAFTGRPENLGEQFCLPDPNDYCIWKRMDSLLMETSDIREFDLDDRYSVILRLMFRIWHYHQSYHTPFPSLHRLPLIATLGSPVPFQTPVETFVRYCMSRSQLATYLSGEWFGWCKDLGRFGGREIPPPFEDIHFVVEEAHPPYAADIVALVSSSSGTDGWGDFTLAGTVSVDGEIWLKKLYAEHLRGNPYSHTGEIWRYRGAITPFGIAGAFEKDNGARHPTGQLLRSREGFFWLWKKEWSHDWP